MLTEAGKRFGLCKMISGTKKLVQAPRKLQTPTTAMPGAANGKRICQNVLRVEAPSIQAASSNSNGTVSRKFFMSQMQKGSALATKKRIQPSSVSCRLSVTYIAYRGVTSARTGKALAKR